MKRRNPWLTMAIVMIGLLVLLLVFLAWRQGGLALLQLGMSICS